MQSLIRLALATAAHRSRSLVGIYEIGIVHAAFGCLGAWPGRGTSGHQRGGHQDNDQNYGLHSVRPLNGYELKRIRSG
jgi:hypothetical protein